MSYRINNNQLTFYWEDGTGIRENMADLLDGIRAAGNYSMECQDTVRIQLPNFEQIGHVEGRSNRSRRFSDRSIYPSLVQQISTDPYLLFMHTENSIYYSISIPGLCSLVDANILAINPEFANWAREIFNEVFNLSISSVVTIPLPPHYAIYTNMPRTLANLTKRPRVPKTVDFAPIFVSLFGEKIATVIMKEIK
jgi:hypothetical protein